MRCQKLQESTYTTVKPLHCCMDVVDKNHIDMYNTRDPLYGKLHLINDISQLVGGPAQQVVQSADQGQPIPYVAPTVREQQNCMHNFREDQKTGWMMKMSKNLLKISLSHESMRNILIN